jgi:hypothetical protein
VGGYEFLASFHHTGLSVGRGCRCAPSRAWTPSEGIPGRPRWSTASRTLRQLERVDGATGKRFRKDGSSRCRQGRRPATIAHRKSYGMGGSDCTARYAKPVCWPPYPWVVLTATRDPFFEIWVGLDPCLPGPRRARWTEAQLQALEKGKADKEAHGEFESGCLGYCGVEDTFFVGTLKGVGRIPAGLHR